MFSNLITAFIGLLCSLAFICMIFAVRNIGTEIPQDDREYKDPLPFKAKIIWPVVNFFAYYFGRYLSVEYIERSKGMLQRAELIYVMEPEQLFGLQLTLMIGFGAICAYTLSLLGDVNFVYVSIASCFGYFVPFLSARDRRKQRELELVRSLPVYLDFIIMALEAGMNLSSAIQQAVEKGPPGPLNSEFSSVLRDVRAGVSRIDALKFMSNRIDLKEFNSLVSALAQAESTGASLSGTLRVQSDQRRVERFQKAEKLALEAPVKLIFPLVAFIFPCTFVVLFFPIVLKFIFET